MVFTKEYFLLTSQYTFLCLNFQNCIISLQYQLGSRSFMCRIQLTQENYKKADCIKSFTKSLFITFLIHYLYYFSLEAEKDPATAEFVDIDKTLDIPVAVSLSKMKTGA